MEPRFHGPDDARIQRALRELSVATGGKAPRTMMAVARYMKTSAQLNFRRQSSPDGMRWWPSRRAKEQAGQTLRDTNRLYRSLTTRSGPAFAEAGTSVPYAAAHNFGIRKIVNIRAHRRTVKGVTKTGRAWAKTFSVKAFARIMFLPQRQFLGFGPADRAEILRLLQEGLVKAQT